jgi:hypothetical protein
MISQNGGLMLMGMQPALPGFLTALHALAGDICQEPVPCIKNMADHLALETRHAARKCRGGLVRSGLQL